jgi:hypothetical protein
MTCSGRWEVCVPLKYFRAVKDDKVDQSYFNLYFVEGSEFISTQLNPKDGKVILNVVVTRERLDKDSYGGPTKVRPAVTE